jgi:hypothetical protein
VNPQKEKKYACAHVNKLGSNNGAAVVGKSATIVLEKLLIQDSSSASISITISKWGPELVGAALKSLLPILVTSSSSWMQLPFIMIVNCLFSNFAS